MNRTRSERRHNDVVKAIRKRNIVKEVYPRDDPSWEYYNNLHQYSKNKIHCSCPLCSSKTRMKKSRGRIYNPPISQLRRMDEMDYETKELNR